MNEYEDELELKVGLVEITAHIGDLAHIQLRTVVDVGNRKGLEKTRLLRRECESLLNALPVMKIREIEATLEPEELLEEEEDDETKILDGLDKEGKPVKIALNRPRRNAKRKRKKDGEESESK